MEDVLHGLRGLLGVVVILAIAFLLSNNRKKINYRLVLVGLALQVIFALGVLKIEFVKNGFKKVSSVFVSVLDFTKEGSLFLFGDLVGNTSNFGYIFAFQVLPTIIFFSALTSVMYYMGILQKIVYAFAWIMNKTMRLSGAESLAAAANIFLGQTEAPLIIKPYIDKMTKSEMMSLMTGGMATIAGGVLVAYIGFLGGEDNASRELFASHLLSASIMSAPAALLLAKIMIPEVETPNQKMEVNKDKIGSNILDAIANGTTEGLKLAINVGAMLLVFTAIMAMLNAILAWGGGIVGLNDIIASSTSGTYDSLSFQFILGYIFAPLSWVMGVANQDLTSVGMLLGEKTILNEFYAYASLGKMKEAGILTNERSIIIATYALCGFANFASIGIQIGGIGALAPNKRVELSQLGIRALIAGTLACFLTACIAGILI